MSPRPLYVLPICGSKERFCFDGRAALCKNRRRCPNRGSSNSVEGIEPKKETDDMDEDDEASWPVETILGFEYRKAHVKRSQRNESRKADKSKGKKKVLPKKAPAAAAAVTAVPVGYKSKYVHRSSGYACVDCTFVAASLVSLNGHCAREHTGDRAAIMEIPVSKYDCHLCLYKSKRRKRMQLHLRKHEPKANEATGIYTCETCDYETSSKMGLQRHISVKHNKARREAAAKSAQDRRQYNCDHCPFVTPNARVMEWHSKRHMTVPGDPPEEGEILRCNDCDEYSTWNKNKLYSHIKRKHEEGADDASADQESFRCELCQYESKSKNTLKIHVIRMHTHVYNFECTLCPKKYKIRADLTNHVRFHHRENPIICDVCGKKCRNSNLLYLHQKFAHYKPKFECKFCSRRMVSQKNLDEHILKQHEQRAAALCQECGKTFTRQSRLKVHMRVHTGDKPYSCKICARSFARRNGLRQHLLTHSGQRPYQCDICLKTFCQKTGLISHRKSHPGSHPPLPRVTIDHIISNMLNEENEN